MEMSYVEKAKSFWSEVDVDLAFEELLEFLLCLRDAIRSNTASDKEYIQGMDILLASGVSLSTALKNDSFEEVLISEDILTVSVTDSHCTLLKMKDGSVPEGILDEDSSSGSRNLEFGSDNSPMSLPSNDDAALSGRFELLDNMVLLSPPNISLDNHVEPLSPVQVSYQQHDCSPVCLSHLPPHADRFLGHNPLRVPLLCHFQRNYAKARLLVEQEEEPKGEEPDPEMTVLYKAPCGRSLRCMANVLQFLQQTESLGILQPSNFSFEPQVLLDRQAQPVPSGSSPVAILFEKDISRGAEAVPVPLYNDVDGVRPKEFRYRKQRWPHGCFLSAAPFFMACCDCKDNCMDPRCCSCLQLSLKTGADPDRLYAHQQLDEPVSTGLYECGPWCGCERSRCQNRVVQRGLRVRLQVFRTCEKGWAVRCCDDLDQGTFVCTYAGVVLRLERSLEEASSFRNQKDELPSDDEVEVVEEWTLPTGQQKPAGEALDASHPLYVPVIRRPADQTAVVLDGEREQQECSDRQKETNTCSSNSSRDAEGQVVRKKIRLDGAEGQGEVGCLDQTVPIGHALKETSQDQMYYLDASKEGNVARFINHSCTPNLFVQNVFVDTHDPKFPTVAFFTCRPIKAGTELTWNYSYSPGSNPEHEVPCMCGYKNCQELVI
ncbi:histone-lysine N-methyltransferase SETDB2 isoform X2 [Brachyhypopomus gauderio]|uniref:histone-lysine N-methyltransferase SETDB2 isoform X2 n=1 Tax=Brachyhypopomus gauderio TaxID=698409 RepID=UPI004042E65F